jgi:hypothetical protein
MGLLAKKLVKVANLISQLQGKTRGTGPAFAFLKGSFHSAHSGAVRVYVYSTTEQYPHVPRHRHCLGTVLSEDAIPILSRLRNPRGW